MNMLLLDQLIHQRDELKAQEEAIVAARRAVDDKIVDIVGHVDEGTLNYPIADKRIVVTFTVDRKVTDAVELARIWPTLPPNVLSCFRPKPPEVAVRQYKDLQVSDPTSFAIIAKLITSKPQRPSIKIEDFDPKKGQRQ